MAKATEKVIANEEPVTERTAPAPEPDMEELVEYTAPLTTPDAKPIFVGVNGEAIRIQRGVPVKIKRKFYLTLMQAQEQELEAYKAKKAAIEATTRALVDM